VSGFVTTVDRGRYGCVLDSGQLIVAMKARELGHGSVVVGDHVSLAGDVSGAPGTLARIVRVSARSSALRRSADDTDPVERVIVANADQMVIVCSLASPSPRLRFVDRCLVAAYDAGLTPLLVLTKADLASPRSVRAVYAPLGLRMVTTRRPLPARTLSSLRSVLTGHVSVLIGQSGVGKSTLVNALVPDAVRATGSVNPVTGRGRHTSSSAVAFPLVVRGRDDGWLIDTPGLRGFGLGNVSADRVVEAFGDLDPSGCPPGCAHVMVPAIGSGGSAGPGGSAGAGGSGGSGGAAGPGGSGGAAGVAEDSGAAATDDSAALAGPEGCTLDEWARSHHAEARLDSLRRLLASREGGIPDLSRLCWPRPSLSHFAGPCLLWKLLALWR
jgi:ribosome biogenesis GTPase